MGIIFFERTVGESPAYFFVYIYGEKGIYKLYKIQSSKSQKEKEKKNITIKTLSTNLILALKEWLALMQTRPGSSLKFSIQRVCVRLGCLLSKIKPVLLVQIIQQAVMMISLNTLSPKSALACNIMSSGCKFVSALAEFQQSTLKGQRKNSGKQFLQLQDCKEHSCNLVRTYFSF